MTNDFEEYQYGALALRLAQSEEGSRFAPGALEELAGPKGLNFGEKALGFIRGTQASKEGIQTAIEVYGGKFEEKRGKYKPSELANWYAPVLADLEEKDRDKILAALREPGESIKSIMDAYMDALNTLKASDRLFSPEQKVNAKKLKDKYEGIINLMFTLDDYKFEILKVGAVDADRKKKLKDLASKF